MTELTSMYKLFTDETRLRILVLLYLDELCVCQLTGITGAPQPRISKNLARLRDLNIVADSRTEKFVYYKLSNIDELIRINLDYIIANLNLYPVIKSDLEKLKIKSHYKKA